jgi:gluconolactonase
MCMRTLPSAAIPTQARKASAILGALALCAGVATSAASAQTMAWHAAQMAQGVLSSDSEADGDDDDSDDDQAAAVHIMAKSGPPKSLAQQVCPKGPFGAPVPAGALATPVAKARPSDAFNAALTADGNVEGPVYLGRKFLVFSEFNFVANPPPSRIIMVKTGHAGRVLVNDSGTNGHALGPRGEFFGGSHKIGGIVRINLNTGQQTVVIDQFDGKRFNSPNDLAVRSDGTIYFSDPDFQAPAPLPQLKTRLYRLAPGSKQAIVVDDARQQPNGVTLSPDEKTLYLAASDGIFKYAVAADGSTGPAQRFTNAVASGDGMVVDCAGNLYITSKDVVVLSPAGQEIARIPAPNPNASVTNVAFGNTDRKTLFITALGGSGRGLYQVKLQVPGLPY